MKSYDELYLEMEKRFSINDKAKRRFMHSISVGEMAVKMNHALNLGLNDEDLKIAGILHDYCKVQSDDELHDIYQKLMPNDVETLKAKSTIHAFLAPILLKEEYPSLKDEILNAIKYHTTARPNMSLMEKVIYVADAVEETRDYADLKYYQKLSQTNLDQAVYEVLDYTVKDLRKCRCFIHKETLDAYDFYQKQNLRDPDLNKVLTTVNETILSDVVLYETCDASPFFDYVIVATASNIRLIHATIEHLRDLAEMEDFNVLGYTKEKDATWAIIDLNNIIVHIFLREDRLKYNIDGLYYHLNKEVF